MSADSSALEEEELGRKDNHQGLMKAKSQEISVLTKTIEEKTVRVGTLAVEVEKMKSVLSVSEKTLLADQEKLLHPGLRVGGAPEAESQRVGRHS